MAKCIGHIFNGRVGGDWRCERCGMAYADRLKELDGGVSGQSGFGRICHDPAAKQSPKLDRGSPMTDEMLVERLRHCIAHPVYTHSQCEDALIAEAADRLSSLEEEKRVLREALDDALAVVLLEPNSPASEQRRQECLARINTALSAGVGR